MIDSLGRTPGACHGRHFDARSKTQLTEAFSTAGASPDGARWGLTVLTIIAHDGVDECA
jgi:hypothetical protein